MLTVLPVSYLTFVCLFLFVFIMKQYGPTTASILKGYMPRLFLFFESSLIFFCRVDKIICVGKASAALFQAILDGPKHLPDETDPFLMNILYVNKLCSDRIIVLFSLSQK